MIVLLFVTGYLVAENAKWQVYEIVTLELSDILNFHLSLLLTGVLIGFLPKEENEKMLKTSAA